MLTEQEILRYSRQTILKEIGTEGQLKLKEAKVLVVGVGGLGGPVLSYLVAAGIGTLGLIDDDVIDLSNLHRQIHFKTERVGETKVAETITYLQGVNPNVELVGYEERLTIENVESVLSAFDIIVDASDNFATRYLVNDVCFFLGKPLVFGAIHQFEGQLSVFNFQGGPNYRDLFPSQPSDHEIPNCAEAGVLGVLPGMIGSLQANEVLKMILGIGEVLSGEMLFLDVLDVEMRKIQIQPQKTNPLLGKTIADLPSFEYVFACGSDLDWTHILPSEFAEWKGKHPDFLLIDVREVEEFSSGNIGGSNQPFSLIHEWKKIIPQGQAILLLCQTGKRSIAAANQLKEENTELELYNLEGGINALLSS